MKETDARYALTEFTPTHLLDGEPVMVIDEGTEDGSSGAYSASTFRSDRWPDVRVRADGVWIESDASFETQSIHPSRIAILPAGFSR